jgi:hypothetical protein
VQLCSRRLPTRTELALARLIFAGAAPAIVTGTATSAAVAASAASPASPCLETREVFAVARVTDRA